MTPGKEGLIIQWKHVAAVQARQGAIRMRNGDVFRPLGTPSHQRNRGLTANYLITKKILLLPTLRGFKREMQLDCQSVYLSPRSDTDGRNTWLLPTRMLLSHAVQIVIRCPR